MDDSCFIAEGSHLFSSLKHIGVVFLSFTQGQMVTGLVGPAATFSLDNPSPQFLSRESCSAGKITGLLCVLATLLQMRQLVLIMEKSVWFTR